jgi:hypothetical protein
LYIEKGAGGKGEGVYSSQFTVNSFGGLQVRRAEDVTQGKPKSRVKSDRATKNRGADQEIGVPGKTAKDGGTLKHKGGALASERKRKGLKTWRACGHGAQHAAPLRRKDKPKSRVKSDCASKPESGIFRG